MIVVSDTSPLLNLALIGHLDLLRALYEQIIVPPAVYHELVVVGAGMPGAADVKNAPWIQVKTVQNASMAASLRLQLHPGEAEAITLALELAADLFLVDERKARFVAARLGVPVTGLIGVLVEAKHKQLVPAVKPILDRLMNEANFYISADLYQRVLQVVGEP